MTSDQNVRLHSCERGSSCSSLENRDVVYITPIISRSSLGDIVPEVGAGGGAGDLIQSHDLRLDDLKGEEVEKFIQLCTKEVVGDEARLKAVGIMSNAILSNGGAVSLNALDPDIGEKTVSLDGLAQLLTRLVNEGDSISSSEPALTRSKLTTERTVPISQGEFLPRSIVCLSRFLQPMH